MNAASTVLNVDLLGADGATKASGADATVEVSELNVNLAATQPAGTVATINLTSAGNFTASSIIGTVDGNGDPTGTLGLTAGTFNSVGEVTAVSGSTIVIDGSAALDIAGFANNINVDASAFAGNLVIQGSSFASGAVGSGSAATVVTQGIDTIELGSGRSVIQFAADGLDSGVIEFIAAGTGAAVATGNILVDVIEGFTAGANGDVLDIVGTGATFTALASGSQTAINNLSGAAATLQGAADLAALGNTAAGWTAFSFQGETYALYESATSTTADAFTNADTLVQLSGVDLAALTADNFA